MVAHSGAVGFEVVDEFTRLVAVGSVQGKSDDNLVDVAGVELVVALPRLLLGKVVATEAVNGLGDIAQTLLDLEAIHDPDGIVSVSPLFDGPLITLFEGRAALHGYSVARQCNG